MRLVRHLTFSNVIAVIALFIALGGAAYAGSKLDGKNIVNGSVGGGKLKNETITANKIKKGTITGAQIKEGSITATAIDVSTLPTVPSATTANTAQSATTAAKADSATTAGTATSATHADEADTAGDAEMIEGESSAELHSELQVKCSGTTEFYGGMCWDTTVRPINFWLKAVKICGNAGGRLPSIGELIAYLSHDGNTPGSDPTWSGDLLPSEKVLTSDDEEHVAESGPSELGYRCVFPQSN